jgi:cytochrome c553
MSRYGLVRTLLAASAVVGCQPTADAGPDLPPRTSPTIDPAPPQQRFERDMMTRLHMHASFDTARAIERLLIRGRVDDARYFARSLASEPDAPGLEPWAKQIALVRERAAAVASAPGIDQACRREAQLAAACAGCHADAGAQPEFRSPPALPAESQTVAGRMARHQWAADRIWEGMIGDSDEAWRAGLDVLAMTPLAFPQIDSDRVGLALRLQQLADQARHPVTNDLVERARLYGEILVTCEACHSLTAK